MPASSKRLEQLMGFLEKSPNEPFILFAIAKEHENLGNQDETLAYYLRLTTDAPDYVGTYYHFGKFYEMQGEDHKAFEIYKKGIEVAKAANDQHSLAELMGAKVELGDDDDFE